MKQKPIAFEKLPVGACFAYEATTKQATRRKAGERHTAFVPNGKKPFRVDDVEQPVYVRPCPASFAGAGGRYVVSGPPGWRRSLHASKQAALEQAKACSKKHPNAVCKVAEGLPGLQKTVAECNRNECWLVDGALGKRRRRRRRKARK
jgi:hypothetical protein